MLLINHHHLYYFWVAAKEGSVVKACEKLHLAQPTVSGQIIKLEKALSRKLFVRQKKGLALTDDGRLVLDYADQIFNYSQELVDALKDQPVQSLLRIQIGIVDQVGKEIAQRLLAALFQSGPRLQATVHQGRLLALLAELKGHTLDAVLSNADVPVEDAGEYLKEEIGSLPVHFAAAPRLAQSIRRFPRDLAHVPLLLPTRASPIWSSVERYLNHHQVQACVLAEVQDAELLHRLTLAGYGAAPLDAVALKTEIKSGKLIRLNRARTGITETFWLVAKKRHRLNPAARRLLDHFRL